MRSRSSVTASRGSEFSTAHQFFDSQLISQRFAGSLKCVCFAYPLRAKISAARKIEEAERTRAYEEWLKNDKGELATRMRESAARNNQPWSPIGGDRRERWQGFTHSAQMSALYRQNVISSARTWPGTTRITTSYENGRITGTSTTRVW